MKAQSRQWEEVARISATSGEEYVRVYVEESGRSRRQPHNATLAARTTAGVGRSVSTACSEHHLWSMLAQPHLPKNSSTRHEALGHYPTS